MQHEYTFAIHPAALLAASWPQVVKDIVARSRLSEEVFTPEGWEGFRDQCERSGWELHEVTRRPYVEPEIVLIP